MDQSSADKSVEILISYSHKDERMRDELVNHLANLKRQGVIADWHDRKISAGNEWAKEIDRHLDTASVILLLISASFMASDYCHDIEVKRAMERYEAGEAKVIPVILRPVDWANAPFSKLQALPTNAKPVSDWSNRDKAYLDIAKGIRNAIEGVSQSGVSDTPAHVTKKTSLPTDTSPVARTDKVITATEFRISLMSGTRCIIEWRPKIPNMTEEVLVAHGVNMDRVKEGILEMAAAVLQRSVEDVVLLPDDPSEHMPGPAYRLSSLGVKDQRYDSFHIYVQESDVTVSIYKLGHYPTIISTEEIGIDWNQFRRGISASLEELYKGELRTQFGDPEIIQYGSGEWHYQLAYMLRPTKP